MLKRQPSRSFPALPIRPRDWTIRHLHLGAIAILLEGELLAMLSSVNDDRIISSRGFTGINNSKVASGHLNLGDVDKTGDTIASPNYGSRVDGHIVNLGDGGISEYACWEG